MNKLKSIIFSVAIAFSAVSVPVTASAEEQITADEVVEYLNQLNTENPEGYKTEGNTVYFINDQTLGSFETNYIINSVSTLFNTERWKKGSLTIGYKFTPKLDGKYLVSSCTTIESIINYNISEDIKNHFHYFYPVIKSYMVEKKGDEVTVELLDEADYSKFTDLEKVKAQYEEKAAKQLAEDPDTAFACFDHYDYTLNELLNSQYLSFVNGKITNGPYYRFLDIYGNIQEQIITANYSEAQEKAMYCATLKTTYEGGSSAVLSTGIATADMVSYGVYTPNEGEYGSLIMDCPYYSARGIVENGKLTGEIYEETPQELIPEKYDINLDGYIGIADLVRLNMHLNGTSFFEVKEMFYAADINEDDKVNIFDLTLMRQKITENLPDFLKSEYRKDSTPYISYSGELAALNKESYVIRSSKELIRTLEPLMRPAAMREFKKRYNNEFFEDNVLLIKLDKQIDNNMLTAVTDIRVNDNNRLEIELQNYKASQPVNEEVVIHQVSYPARDYEKLSGLDRVVWNEVIKPSIDSNESSSPVYDVPVKLISLMAFPKNHRTFENNEPTLISSYDEFMEYINNNYSEDEIERIKEQFEYCKDDAVFNEELFENNIIVLEAVSSSDSPYYISAECYNNKLIIHRQMDDDYGDVISELLNVYIMPRTEYTANSYIDFLDHHIQREWYDVGGNMYEFFNGDEYSRYHIVRALRYDFGDESAVAFYYTGSVGFYMNASNILVADIPIEKGFDPFAYEASGSEQAFSRSGYFKTNERIQSLPVEGENYSIKWNDDSVEISIRTSPDSEFTTYTLPLELEYNFKPVIK